MWKLRERLKDQKGFTLVEMLIVVAIIAILIATSIPMVNNALEKSRHDIDDANYRNAISLANIEILASIDSSTGQPTMTGTYYYKVDNTTHQGSLTNTKGEAEDAKCTGALGSDCSNQNKIIEITFTAGSTDFTIGWVSKS